MSRIYRVASGLVLVVLGTFAVLYSMRVAKAQRIYYAVKYGAFSDAVPNVIASRCEAAHALYPHHYFLCIHAVGRLLPVAYKAEQGERDAALLYVNQWCERGLALNPYHWRLHRAKTRLCAEESPKAAAEYWEAFVDWQFWSPENLAFLVKCYARAGRFAEASETLSLIEGRPEHRSASAVWRAALAADMRPPAQENATTP